MIVTLGTSSNLGNKQQPWEQAAKIDKEQIGKDGKG
jgi:hypothetical protein